MIRADVIRALSGSTVRAPARIMPTYREWDSLAVGPQPIYPVKVRLSFTELRRTAP